MTPTLSSANFGLLLLVALFVLLILRATYRTMTGRPVILATLFALPAIYVLLYVFEVASTYFGLSATSYGSFALDALIADVAMLPVGAVVAFRYVKQRVVLEQRPPDGLWYYRLPPFLPITYLVLFLFRIGMEALVLGVNPFGAPGSGQYTGLSSVTVSLLVAVDVVWGLTTGFLIGRSAGVYSSYAEKRVPEPRPLPTMPGHE